jgi:hypothetical protein
MNDEKLFRQDQAERLLEQADEIPVAYEISAYCPVCREAKVGGMKSTASELKCPTCSGSLAVIKSLLGIVYIVSNPRMPGLLKIGCTTRAVEERLLELNRSTSAPAPFVLEAFFYSEHPYEDEKAIHLRLAGAKLKDREFFEIGLEEALSVCELVCKRRSHIGPVGPPTVCSKCGGSLRLSYTLWLSRRETVYQLRIVVR